MNRSRANKAVRTKRGVVQRAVRLRGGKGLEAWLRGPVRRLCEAREQFEDVELLLSGPHEDPAARGIRRVRVTLCDLYQRTDGAVLGDRAPHLPNGAPAGRLRHGRLGEKGTLMVDAVESMKGFGWERASGGC